MKTASRPTHLHHSTQTPRAVGPSGWPPPGTPAPELGSDLAGARLLRIADVCHLVGLSASQVYQLMVEGAFPQPLRLSSRCSRWRARDVQAWLEALQ
jgi:prophage regulatory protein